MRRLSAPGAPCAARAGRAIYFATFEARAALPRDLRRAAFSPSAADIVHTRHFEFLMQIQNARSTLEACI